VRVRVRLCVLFYIPRLGCLGLLPKLAFSVHWFHLSVHSSPFQTSLFWLLPCSIGNYLPLFAILLQSIFTGRNLLTNNNL
jgi:hypothetical protein